MANAMTFTDDDLKRLKEENECGFCSPMVQGDGKVNEQRTTRD
jgi:hypothetical protein